MSDETVFVVMPNDSSMERVNHASANMEWVPANWADDPVPVSMEGKALIQHGIIGCAEAKNTDGSWSASVFRAPIPDTDPQEYEYEFVNTGCDIMILGGSQ